MDIFKKIVSFFRKRHPSVDLSGGDTIHFDAITVKLSGWELAELARIFTHGDKGIEIAGDIKNYRNLRVLGYVDMRTDHISKEPIFMSEDSLPRVPTPKVFITEPGREYLRKIDADNPWFDDYNSHRAQHSISNSVALVPMTVYPKNGDVCAIYGVNGYRFIYPRLSGWVLAAWWDGKFHYMDLNHPHTFLPIGYIVLPKISK